MSQTHSNGNIKDAAKKYVDEQLEVLKKHGSFSRITKTEYNNMVKQVVKASSK